MFDEIIKREPLTQATVDMIARHLSPIERMVIRLSEVDTSKGAGVLPEMRKCIWTKSGHRITITMIQGGGLMCGISKDVDPDAIPVTVTEKPS